MSEGTILRRLDTLERKTAELTALGREEWALLGRLRRIGERGGPEDDVFPLLSDLAAVYARRRVTLGQPRLPRPTPQEALGRLAEILDCDPRDLAQSFARGR